MFDLSRFHRDFLNFHGKRVNNVVFDDLIRLVIYLHLLDQVHLVLTFLNICQNFGVQVVNLNRGF